MTGERLPRQLGRYELRQRLGGSHLSTVYRAGLAAGEPLDPPVLVRVMHPFAARTHPEYLYSWSAEVRRRTHVDSDHVVRVLKLAAEPGATYAVMTFVEGVSLDDVRRVACQRGEPLAWAVVGRILLDALDGLQAIHEARDATGRLLGLAHGQVDEAVLVGHGGVSVLTDTCDLLAERLLGDRTRHLRKGPSVPTDHDHLVGGPLAQATDIRGAGLLACKLLVGPRLGPGKSTPGLGMGLVMEGDRLKVILPIEPNEPAITSVIQDCPELPDKIDRFVRLTMSPEASEQWPSVRAMRGALAVALESVGPVADRETVARLAQDTTMLLDDPSDEGGSTREASYRDDARGEEVAGRTGATGGAWRRVWGGVSAWLRGRQGP